MCHHPRSTLFEQVSQHAGPGENNKELGRALGKNDTKDTFDQVQKPCSVKQNKSSQKVRGNEGIAHYDLFSTWKSELRTLSHICSIVLSPSVLNRSVQPVPIVAVAFKAVVLKDLCFVFLTPMVIMLRPWDCDEGLALV